MVNTPNIPPGGAASPGGQPQSAARNETSMAGIAHLSSLFAPLMVPLIIWLTARGSMPYAARQAKQAFFFHILLVGLGLVVMNVLVLGYLNTLFANVSQAVTSNTPTPTTFPAWLFALLAFVIVLALTVQALCVYGAVQAFQGKDFSYPGLGWLK